MQAADQKQLCVPPFVTITHVGVHTGAGAYTICNETSGRYFAANAATVTFLEALNRTGSVSRALSRSGIAKAHGDHLIEQMMRFGVLVERGHTRRDTNRPKAPIESRAISVRMDLVDAANVTARLRFVGRLMYSKLGLMLWLTVLGTAVVAFLRNQDKVTFALRQVPETGFVAATMFVLIFLGLKVVHEFGHALAYQRMCEAEGHAPGPIRMGIALFAMTPFPFTDVTGAWRLKSRAARATIGAGGLYFEFLAVALLTILWAVSDSGPLQAVIFQVAMFSTVSSVLFNLNPAVKLDGYYIFSDLLGQPNMAGKGSIAARTVFARTLGADLSRPNRWALAYWGASYVYRWTIFAGVFWIAYQFDPRLAVPVLAIVAMLLVVRPLTASFKFAREKGLRPMRLFLALGFATALLVSMSIPFRDRVLLRGYATEFETTFLRATETAKLSLGTDGLPRFHSPDLEYEAADLAVRVNMLENTARAARVTGEEKARLETDLARLSDMLSSTRKRLDKMDVAIPESAKWDPLTVRQLDQAWVRPGQNKGLGAILSKTDLHLLLWLNQSEFETGLLASQTKPLLVRLDHAPKCEFMAKLSAGAPNLAVQSDAILLTGHPVMPLPPCAQDLKSGTGVVARLPARPKSVFGRLQQMTNRALQDRLPVETLIDEQRT